VLHYYYFRGELVVRKKSSSGKRQQHNHKQNKESIIIPKREGRPVYAWRSILASATLIGGFAAVVTFLPRISIVASDSADPSNPFSASFTIKNTNIVPLSDVSASLGIGQVETTGAHPDPQFIPSFESRLIMPVWQHHDVSMDEGFTITPGDLFKFPNPNVSVSFADIAIVVEYKPWFMPFHREKVFRFVTHQQTNGRLYWYSQTLGRTPN
jgi:hypothetical protein